MVVSLHTHPYSHRIEHISQHQLEEEEARIGGFLAEHRPELVDSYLRMVPSGREGILQRLLSSILRENIAGLAQDAISLVRTEAGWMAKEGSRVPVEAEASVDLLNQQTDHYQGIERIYLLPFRKQHLYVTVPVKLISGFERPLVQGPYHMLHADKAPQRIDHALQIMALLYDEGWQGDESAFRMFAEDVCNSTANLTLAYAYRDLAREHRVPGNDSPMLHNDYTRMEQYVIEGHPCHPGAKMRKGLSPEETLRYSAEFGQPIPLSFVAVHKQLCSFATLEEGQDWNALISEEEPLLLAQAKAHLRLAGLTWDQYALLPIHPWQLEHVLPLLYKQEIEQQIVMPIPDYSSAYFSTMSFRTLAPADRHRPHLKLTAQVHLTGEVRTLSEQTIHNGPLMTRILKRLVEQDSLIPQDRFVPVAEIGGLHFLHPEDKDPFQTDRSENLACVLRENIYRTLQDDEIAVVGSALVAISFESGLPVFAELISRYEKAKAFASTEQALFSFFEAYVSQALWGFIPLMVKYGIGLEGHLQNIVPVFKSDGTPVKLLVRDWEGIRVHRGRLAAAGFDITQFHAKSRILVSDLKSVRNKMFYSVFQNHLGELVLRLTEFYGVDEARFWNVIRETATAVFDRIEEEPAYREQAREDRYIVFNEKSDYKAVTLMRMTGEAHQYTYTKVFNPLSNNQE
jgi:siderophore synthetase component